MTLQQILEKLAVVAGDWCKVYKVGFSLGGEDFWFNEIAEDKNDQYMLFGAICEKCEAEGWHDYQLIKRKDEPFVFTIPVDSQFKGVRNVEAGTGEHPAHAAAQALLAALDAKSTCVCGGTQQVKTIPNCDSGDFTEVLADCPFCTGKQSNQQEQINEGV